jgi:hypothetical protein
MHELLGKRKECEDILYRTPTMNTIPWVKACLKRKFLEIRVASRERHLSAASVGFESFAEDSDSWDFGNMRTEKGACP